MSRRDVLILASALTLSAGVGLSGCTCGDAAVDEAPEEGTTETGASKDPKGTSEQPKSSDGAQPDKAGDADQGSDKGNEKETSKDNEGAKEAGETGKDAKDTPATFASISIEQLQASLKADGWKLIGEPKNTETAGIKYTLFSIIKPPRGGAVMLYDYQDQTVARNFEDHMRKQAAAGGAVRREGGRVLAVTIPRHPKEAERLLLKLAGEPGDADTTSESPASPAAQP